MSGYVHSGSSQNIVFPDDMDFESYPSGRVDEPYIQTVDQMLVIDMSRLPSAGSYSSQCPPSLATDMSSPTTFNSPDPNAAGPSQAGGASQWDPCGIAGPSFQQPDPLSIPASTPEVMASSFSSYNLYGASACYDLYGGESYYNPNDDQYQHGNPVTDTLFFGAGGQFASPTEENMGKMNQQTQDSYLKYYKFETKGANAPFWKLLPEYENTGLALTLPCSDDSGDKMKTPVYPCLEKGCSAKPFKRAADLTRHIRHCHDKANQSTWPCDRRNCGRGKGSPFTRNDHCRDHYRDHHHEDLLRRGTGREGNMTKARGNGNGANRLIPIPDFLADSWINTSWWRCSRCLRRVYVDVHYYHCPDCNLSCEPERKEYREKLRQAEAQKQSKHGTPVIKSE